LKAIAWPATVLIVGAVLRTKFRHAATDPDAHDEAMGAKSRESIYGASIRHSVAREGSGPKTPIALHAKPQHADAGLRGPAQPSRALLNAVSAGLPIPRSSVSRLRHASNRGGLAYAPNHIEPIDIFYEMSGRGERQSPEFFSHPRMAARYPAAAIGAALAEGRHFLDEKLRWNG
jgi:hypothetical protein